MLLIKVNRNSNAFLHNKRVETDPRHPGLADRGLPSVRAVGVIGPLRPLAVSDGVQ